MANYLEKNGSAEGIAPADLEATLKGLRGGDLDNLTLVNSGVKASDSEEGFESRGEVRKRYHENMHKGGLDDENLTHQLDKAMVELRVTGGPKGEEHNSIKIGRMAAEKKASGMSNDQIMKEMRQAMVKDFGGKATLPKVFKENAPTASVINNITNNNVSNLRQGDVITNEGDTHNTTNVSGTSASDIKKTIDNSLKNNNPKLVRNIGGKVAGAVRPIAAGIKKQTLMQRKQGSKLSGLKDEIEDIDGGSDES